MRPRRAFLHDAAVRARVVVHQVVVHHRVVVRPDPGAHHDAAREVAEDRVVHQRLVRRIMPELNPPAGILERNVVGDVTAAAG